MAVLAQGHDGAQEGQPDEKPAREFLRDSDARIEAVAQHHIAEDQNDHDCQEKGNQDLQELKVAFHNHVHGRFLWCSSLLFCLIWTRHID